MLLLHVPRVPKGKRHLNKNKYYIKLISIQMYTLTSTYIMLIHYISDIHLEKRLFTVSKEMVGHALFVAGDLGHPHCPVFKSTLETMSRQWKHVFYVPGNHEYERSEEIEYDLNKATRNLPNINVLKTGKTFPLGEYNVIGDTLWSFSSNPKSKKRREKNERHLYQRQMLHQTIQKSTRPVIVMTHYLPSFKLVLPQFLKRFNPEGWASHCDFAMAPPVKVWICGHSHIQYDNYINNVRVLMNATGKTIQSREI